MKFLFDENLSPMLVGRMADLCPGSTHVRDVGLKSAIDPVVWEFAEKNGFTIVSKDSDMHDKSLVYGFPPKVIWIRLGNCSTSDVEELIRRQFATVELFIVDEIASFLALS